MSAAIRPACPEDVARIAALHVTAWHETFRGLLSEAVIAAQNQAKREALWRARLDSALPDSALFVAEEGGPGGPLVAFGACGRRRDDLAGLSLPGEFHALYVLRRAQRAGIGGALMRRMAAAMLDRGLGGASLWVLRGNLAARAFYTELGGEVVATRENAELGGAPEVAFAWHDLRGLAVPRE
ncbi:MAG: GNAT family N-acetyltransferase [Acetobacteraceae bacterium]|nr:GNAT family N-acetyltransferase [Acetobacteraceae bacterium]